VVAAAPGLCVGLYGHLLLLILLLPILLALAAIVEGVAPEAAVAAAVGSLGATSILRCGGQILILLVIVLNDAALLQEVLEGLDTLAGDVLAVLDVQQAVQQIQLRLLVVAIAGQLGQQRPLVDHKGVDVVMVLLLLLEELHVHLIGGLRGREVFADEGDGLVPGGGLLADALPPGARQPVEQQRDPLKGVLNFSIY